jgi:hypothetical protein
MFHREWAPKMTQKAIPLEINTFQRCKTCKKKKKQRKKQKQKGTKCEKAKRDAKKKIEVCIALQKNDQNYSLFLHSIPIALHF